MFYPQHNYFGVCRHGRTVLQEEGNFKPQYSEATTRFPLFSSHATPNSKVTNATKKKKLHIKTNHFIIKYIFHRPEKISRF
jgi:hypothetical protein